MAFALPSPSLTTFRNVVCILAVIFGLVTSSTFRQYFIGAISCGLLLFCFLCSVEEYEPLVETATPLPPPLIGQVEGPYTENLRALGLLQEINPSHFPPQYLTEKKAEIRPTNPTPRLPPNFSSRARGFGYEVKSKEPRSLRSAPHPRPYLADNAYDSATFGGKLQVPSQHTTETRSLNPTPRLLPVRKPINNAHDGKALGLSDKTEKEKNEFLRGEYSEEHMKLRAMLLKSQKEAEMKYISRLPAYCRDFNGRLKNCVGRWYQFLYRILPPGGHTPVVFNIRTELYELHTGFWPLPDPFDLTSEPQPYNPQEHTPRATNAPPVFEQESNGTVPFNGTGMSPTNPSNAPANGNAGIASTALSGTGASQPNVNRTNAPPNGNSGSAFGGLDLAAAMTKVNNKAVSSNNTQATSTTPSSIFPTPNSNNNPLFATGTAPTKPTSTTSGVPRSGPTGFVLTPQNAASKLGSTNSTAASSNNTSVPRPSNPFSTASNTGSLFAAQNSGNTNAPTSNPFAANTTARNPFSNVSNVTQVGSGGAFAQAPSSNSGVSHAGSFNTTFTTRAPMTPPGTNNFATTAIDPKGKRPANQSSLIFGNQTSTYQSSGGNGVFGPTSSPNITQPANSKKSSNGNPLPQCLDDDLYLSTDSMILCDTPQKKHEWIKRKLAEPQKFVAELVYHDKPTKEWRPKFLEHCATLKKIMRAISTDIAPFGDWREEKLPKELACKAGLGGKLFKRCLDVLDELADNPTYRTPDLMQTRNKVREVYNLVL